MTVTGNVKRGRGRPKTNQQFEDNKKTVAEIESEGESEIIAKSLNLRITEFPATSGSAVRGKDRPKNIVKGRGRPKKNIQLDEEHSERDSDTDTDDSTSISASNKETQEKVGTAAAGIRGRGRPSKDSKKDRDRPKKNNHSEGIEQSKSDGGSGIEIGSVVSTSIHPSESKKRTQENTKSTTTAAAGIVVTGRGRPKKNAQLENIEHSKLVRGSDSDSHDAMSNSTNKRTLEDANTAVAEIKRGRGRPKKDAKGRGRPKKNAIN